MPDFIGIARANERQKEFENERRNRGFIPDNLVNLMVLKSMMSGEDVVDLWLGFVDFIRVHWGVLDWTEEDNSMLEGWFESYAI